MGLIVSCDICGDPVELADEVHDCEGCWRTFGPCCESSSPDLCIECAAEDEAPDEEDTA